MPSETPFVDPLTNELDAVQLLREAVALGKLVAIVALAALVPFLFVVLFGAGSAFGTVFLFATQFVLAVGSGLVLMYVVARAHELVDDDHEDANDRDDQLDGADRA
jgi:membrane protein implicated in regulation of membrane protease activity